MKPETHVAVVSAQPAPSEATVFSVSRVILYKSGIGYLEHFAYRHGNQVTKPVTSMILKSRCALARSCALQLSHRSSIAWMVKRATLHTTLSGRLGSRYRLPISGETDESVCRRFLTFAHSVRRQISSGQMFDVMKKLGGSSLVEDGNGKPNWASYAGLLKSNWADGNRKQREVR